METLIYSYHFAVIAIIVITFVATILSMAKIGPFANVPTATTKILVASLIVELAGAFIGVYKTLPQLKFDVSEKYRFEISYGDISTSWLNNLSEEDKALVVPFIEDGEMESFLRFSAYVDKYREIKNFSRIGSTHWMEYYAKFMNDEQTEYVNIYRNSYKESPSKVRHALDLMKKYTRMKGSANKTGNGYMWASTTGDKMEGIVVYAFPDGQQIPTVLEFEGQKKREKTKIVLQLNFTQRMSALSSAGHFFPRPGGSFSVELEPEGGAYVGPLKTYGKIRIQVWEL